LFSAPYVKSATGGNALKGFKYARLFPLTTPVLSPQDKLLPSVDYMKGVPEPGTRTATTLDQTATVLLFSLGLSSASSSRGTLPVEYCAQKHSVPPVRSFKVQQNFLVRAIKCRDLCSTSNSNCEE
jgi:hypothetical protein